MTKTTPLMQQYWSLKQDYPDTLLLFQVGDFYELFFNDAQKAAAFLGITLTKRGKDKGKDIPLCGVPVHALDHYLAKLVKGGFCVAICDQLEQAVPGKMVKRGITRVLTPGTLTEGSLLAEGTPSYVLSFVPHGDDWALLFAELMTAQLYATTLLAGSMKSLETELARFFPDEIILSGDVQGFQTLFQKQGYFTSLSSTDTTGMLAWAHSKLHEATCKQIEANKALEQALGALYAYFKKNNEAALHEFSALHFYEPDDFMVLDAASLRNLEIIKNNQDGTSAYTLFSVLDRTKTAMGSRTLKKWLVRPLVQKSMIEHRLELVGWIKNDFSIMESVRKMLQSVGDLERVVGRIALGRGKLDDYLHTLHALQTVMQSSIRHDALPQFLQVIMQHAQSFVPVMQLLERALYDQHVHEWVIKEGFDEHLDRLRLLVHTTHEALQRLEKQEQQVTGINSLKIRYTSVHGYYIEITHANAHLVPAHYKRQQTLVGKERYMCPALQELQHEIMTARNEIEQVEKDLFKVIQQQVRPFVGGLRKLAHMLGQLDVLCSFAYCAYERGYTRPQFVDSHDSQIIQGKHPVVAESVGSAFVPNDTIFNKEQALWIITGPNMGGKSTFLRQTALMSVMAQCGSYVPAQLAQLPLYDALFTRIGASDNVAEGKSTFLVEMEETAHICQYATASSLVILDEVGRGTSTFDGISLAQAVIEHIHTQIKAHCLFATHYHELTALADTLPGVVNYHVASKKRDTEIIFLHTMIPGVAQGSFGLAVAHLAHLPPSVIARAYEVMHLLSKSASDNVVPESKLESRVPELIVPAVTFDKKTIDLLRSIDYENLSPKKAFDLLWQLKDSF